MSDSNPNKQERPAQPKRAIKRRLIVQTVVGVGVLIVGIVIAALLVKAKQAPETAVIEHPGALVDAVTVHAADVTMVIESYGTVEPRVQVQVVPQVSGKVVKVNPSLAAGGFVKAGEPLIEIDRADYDLAVQRAAASLASAHSAVQQADAGIEQARTQLQIEQAEGDVAQAEWASQHPGEKADPLVLRQPQIRRAQAMVSSAEAQRASAEASVEQATAAVDEAKLNVWRTSVSLPYDARVLSESADLGQYVAPGQPIASLYGVEKVEITVMLDNRDLAWFDLPTGGEGGGSPVEVSADFAGGKQVWTGRVARMGGQVDVKSRLVPIVVEVDRPFDANGDRPPLVPGMFVKVAIRGRTVPNLIAVPRSAVHDADTVWVVRDGLLKIVQLTIARADRDTTYTTNGLHDGDQVILSLLDAITDGMKVRTSAGANAKPETRNPKSEGDGGG
jgi:RND family efflux transporter MFP subunit